MLNESRYVLDNINVFIVDDNRHMRSLVQSILHALGVKEIGEAGDAAEAFTELQHFIADVLIVDWHMDEQPETLPASMADALRSLGLL